MTRQRVGEIVRGAATLASTTPRLTSDHADAVRLAGRWTFVTCAACA